MVAFPYWMANIGQRCRHARHMTHRSGTMTGFRFSIFIARMGQILLHSPQPSQRSVTQNILVFCNP